MLGWVYRVQYGIYHLSGKGKEFLVKRSDALILIANQLDFLNGTFSGFRTAFSSEELSKADVILTSLEHSGMAPPVVNERSSQIQPNDKMVCECREWED